MAEGGCGGNSAIPMQKIEASPAALLVESRTQQKSFLFLLEEKIRRAQIRKSEENFFAGWRVVASGGGLASLVPFKVGSSKVQNIPPIRNSTVFSKPEGGTREARPTDFPPFFQTNSDFRLRRDKALGKMTLPNPCRILPNAFSISVANISKIKLAGQLRCSLQGLFQWELVLESKNYADNI